MLFMQTQQVQPALHMATMQSQQAWIIAQHAGSPLVQVMQTPSSVISHLHMPIIMLQQQTIMPFIIMQQLHMPPAIIVQRFCIMLADILSSQEHMIFMPSLHFSIFMVQRGTIIHCGVVGMVAVPPIVPDIIGFIPVIMPDRSVIIAVVIVLPFGVYLGFGGTLQSVSFPHRFLIMTARIANARKKHKNLSMDHDHSDLLGQVPYSERPLRRPTRQSSVTCGPGAHAQKRQTEPGIGPQFTSAPQPESTLQAYAARATARRSSWLFLET
ncbi:MAG: hypothetical protein ACLP7Q_10555 [Isosphaeraceae bacterium]